MNNTNTLLNTLIQHSKKSKIQFHMPAHSSGKSILQDFKDFTGNNIFKLDQTELDELDNLSNPTGIIEQTQKNISSIYKTKMSFMLINGSTSGILAVLTSVLCDKSKVIVSRNCHKSVISALIATGANPIWVLPEWNNKFEIFDSITPEVIEKSIGSNPDVAAVVITSPTYEGICSDITEISHICKRNKIALIVDEAHGGHFIFNDKLPESAVNLGADSVIHSTHKTCTSLTQGSLLHIPNESILDVKRISECLNLFNTSSPSYILMASIDAAVRYMNSDEGRSKLEKNLNLVNKYRKEINLIDKISIYDFKQEKFQDKTKLLISFSDLDGHSLADILENKHSIYIESCNNKSILAQVNIGNDEDDINKLYNALINISNSEYKQLKHKSTETSIPKQILSPREAFFANSEKVLRSKAVGRISIYSHTKCPPGYPFLLSGEQITHEHVNYFKPDEYIDVVR